MSLQDSVFNTTHVMDNEIVKASDFEFAFENLIKNVALSTQMMLESNQDFVINGKVLPYSGMSVVVSPIYGVCKSTGLPFGRTEASESFGIAGSDTGRVDIIEVQGDWETYDNQQRAFNDPDTDTQTYQYVDTKKRMKPIYQVKKGEDGSSVAPTVDSGWVKIAEVVIRAGATTILESDIKNITSDVAGLDNADWTTERDITYNIGYISDVNARFRVQHNADGTHAAKCINSDSLDIGTGSKQINGNILPIGGAVTIPSQTAISSTDSILSVITKAVNVITTLYNNYLKFGTYGFEGEILISATDTDDVLDNPLKLSADGSGNAAIKVGNTTVLSIDTNGKLHASYNSLTSADNGYTLVTKAITDAISTALDRLTTRVENIEQTSDVTVYANGTLSAGTDGRYNISSASIYAATTQNITLSGSQTIDGTTPTDGVYILVKNQTNQKENGIYAYSSNSVWNRVNDFLAPNNLKGKLFSVNNGTTNGKKMFYLTKVNFVDGSDFGSDDIIFSEYFGAVLPAASRVVMRDSGGRAKVADPVASQDAVSKNYLESVFFNTVYPVGITYTQYPGQLSPNDLWGGISTWELLDYGGAFFRSSGGNADSFEKSLSISSISGTTITFASAHGLAVGSVIYDNVNNEGRVVTAVSSTTKVTINSAFTNSNLSNVFIGQPDQNKSHSHTTNTISKTSVSTGSVSTGYMSGNSSGGIRSADGGHPLDSNAVTGCIGGYTSATGLNAGKNAISTTTTSSSTTNGNTINVQHTHRYDHSHDISHTHTTDSNGGTETRTNNFTYKIWIRTE